MVVHSILPLVVVRIPSVVSTLVSSKISRATSCVTVLSPSCSVVVVLSVEDFGEEAFLPTRFLDGVLGLPATLPIPLVEPFFEPCLLIPLVVEICEERGEDQSDELGAAM